MDEPKLGTPPAADAKRDAVHVAVMPMVAVREMRPGERLANGIVDPFRTDTVRPGAWFWLCLYPQTTTSLRHVWAHPAFPCEAPLPEKARSEADVWADDAAAAFGEAIKTMFPVKDAP